MHVQSLLIGILGLSLGQVLSQENSAPAQLKQEQKKFWPEHDVPKIDGQVQEWYDLGLSFYRIGNYKEALSLFQKIQQSAAHHTPSLVYRNACVLKMNKELIAESGQWKALELVEFPAVKLENASLAEFFDYLQQRVGEITNGECTINLVFRGTEQQRKKRKVTFELKQGGVADLLNYAARLSNCQLRIGQYAVEVVPLGGAR